MTTALHRMIPPANGLFNPIKVNGRSYSATANSFVDVPAHDALVMEANGWTLFAGSSGVGTTAGRPTNPVQRQTFMDTTLSKSIIFDGKNWRDPLSGAIV